MEEGELQLNTICPLATPVAGNALGVKMVGPLPAAAVKALGAVGGAAHLRRLGEYHFPRAQTATVPPTKPPCV